MLGRTTCPRQMGELGIKVFKDIPKLQQDFEKDKVDQLRAATEEIFFQRQPRHSQNELYRAVQSLCHENFAEKLFSTLKSDFNRHIDANIAKSFSEASSVRDVSEASWTNLEQQSAEQWLSTVDVLWSNHCLAVSHISQIYCLLDGSFVRHSDAKSIRNLALSLFRNHLSTRRSPAGKPPNYSPLVAKTEASLLKLLDDERRGKPIPSAKVARIFQMFSFIQLYDGPGGVEEAVLKSTADFYRVESAEMLEALPSTEYIRYMRRRLEEEEKRVKLYLELDTMKPLMRVALKLLVDDHKETILGYHSTATAPKGTEAVGGGDWKQGGAEPKGAAGGADGERKEKSSDKCVASGEEALLLPIPRRDGAPDCLVPAVSLLPDEDKDPIFDQMIMNQDVENLGTLYTLYNLIDQFSMLRNALVQCVKRQAWRIIIKFLAGSALTTSESPTSSIAAVIASTSFNIAPSSPMPTPEGAALATAASSFRIKASREEQKQFIPHQLTFKRKVDVALKNAFDSSDDLSLAMQDAWQETLNSNTQLANVAAQLLARHCDEVLRAKLAPGEVDAILSNVITMFRVLQSKDYFEAFYKKDLGRRLLLGKSASFDTERLMVQKLKDECGSSFTSKLEGMFKELDVSKDIFKSFVRDVASRTAVQTVGIDFEGHVLASAIWPHPYSCPNPTTPSAGLPKVIASDGLDALATASADIVIPPPAMKLQNIYTDFYKKLHSGRVLQWVPALGSCVIRASFPVNKSAAASILQSSSADSAAISSAAAAQFPTRHELVVSQIQGISLLLFNDHSVLTVSEIQKATGVEEKELQRQLLALCVHPKKRVLIKKAQPIEGEVAVKRAAGQPKSDDQYFVNKNFTSKSMRIVITQIQLKETREETEATEMRVEEDRSCHLDAAIVRIMKTEKKLHHTQLMSQLFWQLKFKTTPQAIKKRIESLIEREFVERDEKDSETFKYLS